MAILNRRAALLSLTGLGLAGCVTGERPAPRPDLALEARPDLGRIDLIVNESQTRIRAVTASTTASLDFASSVATGFNNARLEDRANRINAALATFDYPADVLQAARTAFTTVKRLDVTLPTTVIRTGASGVLPVFEASTASAVLIFGVTYLLDPQGAVRFDGMSWLMPKNPALKFGRPLDSAPLAATNAIYRKLFRFSRNPGTTPEEIHAAFVEGANSVAAQAAADFDTVR